MLFRSPSIHGYFNDWQFQRQLPEYSAVVGIIKAGPVGDSGDHREVDLSQMRPMPGRAVAVWATYCDDKNVIVRFLLPSGGAVAPHWGYIYDDCDDVLENQGPASVRRPRESHYHIQGPWYEFYRP